MEIFLGAIALFGTKKGNKQWRWCLSHAMWKASRQSLKWNTPRPSLTQDDNLICGTYFRDRALVHGIDCRTRFNRDTQLARCRALDLGSRGREKRREDGTSLQACPGGCQFQWMWIIRIIRDYKNSFRPLASQTARVQVLTAQKYGRVGIG